MEFYAIIPVIWFAVGEEKKKTLAPTQITGKRWHFCHITFFNFNNGIIKDMKYSYHSVIRLRDTPCRLIAKSVGVQKSISYDENQALVE